MAEVACTVASFVAAGNCFNGSNWNQTERQALKVYRLAQLVYSLSGGTVDYRTASTLWTAANTSTCGMTDNQVEAAMFGVLNNQFNEAETYTWQSPPAPLTLATASAAIACFKEYSMWQLQREELFLWCTLFNLAA